mgnify:FL=1
MEHGKKAEIRHQHPKRTATLAVLIALASLTFTACRITDHTEEDADGITTNAMEVPVSGYKNADPSMRPVLTIDSTARHMGKIAEGVLVEKTYGFINNGKSDLVITDVRGSCGCTVAKNWPRMPVGPGERSAITVSFNSEGRPGVQHKTITVVANTDPPTSVLTLSGEVVAPPTE